MSVKPELLRWACDRAGKPESALAEKFSGFTDWLAGAKDPTLKQLEDFAKATRTPFGFFFLAAPPVETLPIPDFRTVGGERIQRPSPDLLDTIYLCQQRQDWYRQNALLLGESPLQFIGSATVQSDVVATAARIRQAVGFDLDARAEAATFIDALRMMIEAADQAGVLVMVSGIVGHNTHRPLDTAEFRGFALCDEPPYKEIREEILLLAQMLEGETRQRELTAMRLEALRLMRALARFKPRLIGSVLTGHIRKGSDIDLQVFTDSLGLVEDVLSELGLEYQVEHKRVLKHHEQRVFTHIHVEAAFSVELTLYGTDKTNYPFKSSITGTVMDRAGIPELETLLRETVPDLESEMDRAADHADAWELFTVLLAALEKVKQNPAYHPEGDALFHSLQVFELARAARPWDEEFLLAALLHDVGKAIDPRDHVAAGLQALEGLITDRTAWLIEHHMEAHECRAGTLGHRARRRLMESEDFEDLMLLSELDQAGRVRGAVVPSVDEALEFIRAINEPA